MNQTIQCRKAKCLSTALFPWYPAALNVPVSEYNDKCTAGFSGSIFFFPLPVRIMLQMLNIFYNTWFVKFMIKAVISD